MQGHFLKAVIVSGFDLKINFFNGADFQISPWLANAESGFGILAGLDKVIVSQADCLAFVYRRNIVETVFLHRHSCFQPIAFFCLQFNLLAVVQNNDTCG